MFSSANSGWTKYQDPNAPSVVQYNWNDAYYQTEFVAAPENPIVTQICGEASGGEWSVGFGTEVGAGGEIGGNYYITFGATGWLSWSWTHVTTQQVTLPGKQCTQYKAVPVVEKIQLRTENYFIGAYSYPYSPSGTPYKDYHSGTSYKDVGYFSAIKHVRCKAKCRSCECDEYWKTNTW